MESLFHNAAATIALILEAMSLLIILIGAAETGWRLLSGRSGGRRAAWQNFARWLLMGLEFTLAADIVKTAVAPTWNDIGQLAAIAAIRTFLNFFLERDLQQATTEAP